MGRVAERGSLDVNDEFVIFLIKFIGGIIATVILVPLVVLICLPHLLLVSLVDTGKY